MNIPEIRIIQGSAQPYPASDINIVIDVIRAFTVSQIAFLRGVTDILLVNTVEEAFALKAQYPELLLAGEIKGLPIPGFDLDNSPHTFSTANLAGRKLVQKTSNGVKATLHALNARHVFVTGLSNARNTALHARRLVEQGNITAINIIASHEGDDDDLACAEYIQSLLLGMNLIDPETVSQRILQSRPAQKFFDPQQPEFDVRDMDYCTQETACDFVMKVDVASPIPRIIKVTTAS